MEAAKAALERAKAEVPAHHLRRWAGADSPTSIIEPYDPGRRRR